jgi:hypothetical protein
MFLNRATSVDVIYNANYFNYLLENKGCIEASSSAGRLKSNEYCSFAAGAADKQMRAIKLD